MHSSTLPPTLCVLGATGVGKGSTLNSCFRSDKFGVSSMFASDTIKPVSFVLPWRGAGEPMRGVDLCGFSDSEGRDTGFIEGMVSYLKEEVGFVNCFLLLLNAQEPRIGMHLKDMLCELKKVFGVHFMRNVTVGFTRWDYTKKGAIMRRGVTKDVLSSSINGLLRELLGNDHDCPCVYLDNTLNLFGDEDLAELHGAELPLVQAAFEEALEAVRLVAVGSAPFQCADIEGTVAERDVGRDLQEREAAAIAHGREAVEGFARAWAQLGTEEPAALEAKLQAAGQAARDQLAQWLTAKTRPDLEHVLQQVGASHILIHENSVHALRECTVCIDREARPRPAHLLRAPAQRCTASAREKSRGQWPREPGRAPGLYLTPPRPQPSAPLSCQVLASFDSGAAQTISDALYKNRTDASSFNRSLRVQLVQEYSCAPHGQLEHLRLGLPAHSLCLSSLSLSLSLSLKPL